MAGSRIKIALLVIIIVVIFAFGVSFVVSLASRPFGDRIGIVEIEGVISDSRDVMADIQRFKEDDAIKGVIVRINSPGGSVAPTQEIFRELKKLGEKKKIYVSMGGLCASGGYYIATAGEKLYASPSTVTGSIGVIMEQVVVEDLLKKIGVQPNTLKSGVFKDAGSPFRKMKPEERAYFQEIMDGIHGQFIKDVAEGRKMPVEVMKKLADGRVYTGTQAKSLKLVDRIGTLYDAIDDMKLVLNIRGKPVLVQGKRPFSLIRWLMSSMVREIGTEIMSRRYDPPFQYLYSP
jgi:protease-4